jgi:hypothetical protein
MKPTSNLSDKSAINALRNEFGIEYDRSGKISQFGGIEIFLEFLRQGSFKARFTAKFGSQKARTLLQILIGVIVGAKSMEEVERIGKDPIVSKFLKTDLVSAVGAIQLTRDLKLFTKIQLEELHQFIAGMSLAEISQVFSKGTKLSFDVDATAVEKYGEQEGVEKGYLEKDRIEDCYQYLFFRNHELNTLIYGTIRAGSAHSQNGFCEYLKRILPQIGSYYRTTWRIDSGFFSEDSIDLFSEHDATFFVKAPMSPSRLRLVTQAKDWVWHRDEKSQAEYSSYVTQTKKGTKYREVYKRTKLKRDQLALFEEINCRYDCLATNDLVLMEFETYQSYNPRANIENINREIKNDYALGKLVTDDFDANDVITQVTLLAFILMSHIKRNYLPKEMSRHQLGTLRWRLFQIPGRIFWTARRGMLRIVNVFCSEKNLLAIYRAISRTLSWIAKPPPIAQFSL